LQGTFVTNEEIDEVVRFVKEQQKPDYLFKQEELLQKAVVQDEEDELFREACEFVVRQGGASTSMLQRKLRVGFARAGRLMDLLERRGATVLDTRTGAIDEALRALATRDVQSLLVEGGAQLHDALWDVDVIDYVQLYVAPVWLGSGGVPVFGGRHVSTATLLERQVSLLGPDVLIEGYVHRPH